MENRVLKSLRDELAGIEALICGAKEKGNMRSLRFWTWARENCLDEIERMENSIMPLYKNTRFHVDNSGTG